MVAAVALTGATGFVGGHVLGRLLEHGHSVQALTRRPQPLREGVTWIDGALDRPSSLAKLVDGAHTVIHVAGVVNAPDAAGFDAGNRQGTQAMLDATRDAGIKRFVHISSIAAREPHLSNYCATKRGGEDLVVASNLDWDIIRPPAVYGPGDTELLGLFQMAKRGIVALPPVGQLSIIHADDLARLIVALAESDATRTILEPDDGKSGGWTHREFAEAIGNAFGRKVRSFPMPKAGMKMAAALDGLVRRDKAKLTADRVNYLCHPDWVSNPVRRPPIELWQAAIATRDGLKSTVDWYCDRGLL